MNILRLLTFLSFTIPSGLSLFISFDVNPRHLAETFAECEFSNTEGKQCNKLTISSISSALVWSAWALYFIIGYRWVRFGYVGKNIRILGAIVGSLALMSVPLFGVIYVLPAVLLMLYIHIKSPYGAQA